MEDARFMPLEEAVKSRDFELRLAAENEDLPEFPAARFFDPDWFPFLSTSAGNLYVVERFGAGRVLLVDREDIADREVLAGSLVDFIDRLASDGPDFQPPPLSDPVDLLVRDLESPSPAERNKAVRELTRKKPPSAFRPLVAMLESTDPEARKYAALLLGQIGDRRAIPILIRCIGRWSGKNVTNAYGGLMAIGPERPLDHLTNALATGDPELRRDAIKGLEISRDPGAAAAIEPATNDPDPAVREAAEAAMRRLRGH
jgi:HEAT repeat protein